MKDKKPIPEHILRSFLECFIGKGDPRGIGFDVKFLNNFKGRRRLRKKKAFKVINRIYKEVVVKHMERVSNER